MTSSREESPDWLRSFKAPIEANSPLILSSDSESVQYGSPSRDNSIDLEGPSLQSPTFPENDKNQDMGLAEADEESLSRKALKTKSSKIQEGISPKKKKVYKRKKREGNEGDKQVPKEVNIEKQTKLEETIHSIWTLSSDSESCHDHSPTREDLVQPAESSQKQKSQFQEIEKCRGAIPGGSKGKSPSKKASKEKSLQKQIDLESHTLTKGKKIKGSTYREENGGDVHVAEEETPDKHREPNVSSSRLPLVLSEKVNRTKALVECEGDSIDLSGDMGVVGRVVISDSPSGNQEMYLDLKGTIYKTAIIPSRTFCVVSLNQSEAKIEAIMDDFIQLKPQSNVYEAETMVEGTLEGFSFDSEDEAEKMPKVISHQTDQNEQVQEQINGKTKGKADKTSGVARKRGNSTGGKPQPPKKVRKKTQGPKKAKTKK